MNVTLGEIVNAVPALNKAAGQDMPIKASYRLAKLLKELSPEAELYDKQRLKLCQKYGALDEDKQAYNIPTENMSDFEAEMNELLSQEVEISAQPVTVPDELRLPAAEVLAAEKFITIGGDE